MRNQGGVTVVVVGLELKDALGMKVTDFVVLGWETYV